MSFKDILYLELWWPWYSVQQNHLCNCGREHYEEHFCELILNLVQWYQEIPFKDISNLQLWWPYFSTEQNHLCNFGRRHL